MIKRCPWTDVVKNLIRCSAQAMQLLRVAAEQIKCDLATSPSSSRTVTMPKLGDDEGMVFEARLNRVDLETIIGHLIRTTMTIVNQVIMKAHINEKKITCVVLVGGSSRLPLVQKSLRARFPSAAMRTDIDPDTIVAQGAALLAARIFFKQGEIVHDVAPLGLGIEVQGGIMSVSYDDDETTLTLRSMFVLLISR